MSPVSLMHSWCMVKIKKISSIPFGHICTLAFLLYNCRVLKGGGSDSPNLP